MAKLAQKRGFFKPGNVVKIMSVDVSFKTFLHERTVGYQDGIIKNSPLKKTDIIAKDNETGMFEQVLPWPRPSSTPTRRSPIGWSPA